MIVRVMGVLSHWEQVNRGMWNNLSLATLIEATYEGVIDALCVDLVDGW